MSPIRGSTAVYALLGAPVAHSRSPELHNAWFARHGIDAVYVAFEATDPSAVDAAFHLGIAGANLTTPLKQAALGRVRCEPDAIAIGAVNVLVREPGGWLGANTDADGFVRSLVRRGVELRGRRCVILGAGGAARAVGVGLRRAGVASISVRARRPEAAAELAERLGGRAGPLADPAAIDGADLVVVATAGRPDAVAALDPARLAPRAVWADLNYWDPDPPGYRRAADAGCFVVDGWGMLVEQGAAAFARWTGVQPDLDAIGIAPPPTM